MCSLIDYSRHACVLNKGLLYEGVNRSLIAVLYLTKYYMYIYLFELENSIQRFINTKIFNNFELFQ